MQSAFSNGIMEPLTTTFFDLVRDRMPAVEAAMRKSSSDHNPHLAEVVDQLIASGGKRVRPALVLLSGEMLEAPRDRTVTLAAAIEMLHTATLVHDDLIDGASLRRGTPTVNSQWPAGATVLTGDYVFARAASLAARTRSLEVMECFADTLMTIVNGEINQLFQTDRAATRRDYLARIYAKTGSLFELACRGPGLLANCSPEELRVISHFGYQVGMAFQIVDDILDFTGDQERVGKPVASDLRQGLVTLPTLIYLETASDTVDLKAWLDGAGLPEGNLEAIIARIRNSRAIEASLAEAGELIDQAVASLETFPDSSSRQGLRDLARYVVRRSL